MKYATIHLDRVSNFIITYHAVEQFRSRWEPNKTFEEAQDELFCLLNTSKQDSKTLLGDKVYVSGHRPEIRMVIKDYNVCVTVLPPLTAAYDNLVFDEEEFLKEERQNLEDLYQSKRESILHQIVEVEKEKAALDEEKKAALAPFAARHSDISSRLQKLKQQLQKCAV